MVSHGGKPDLQPIPLQEGSIEIGRDALLHILGDAFADTAMSRVHATVAFDDKVWSIADRGSRNGTFVDGERVSVCTKAAPQVLRIGHTIFVVFADLTAIEPATIMVEGGVVVGPRLRRAWNEIARLARSGRVLHLTGETGSGKELAAHHYHRSAAQAGGPLVAANCATIPAQLAERLLFGARRGAYSGADSDSEGYLQAAHGGTLFLDEIGELELGVQAKLLRVLETQEVVPLGATRGRKIDFRLVSATHQDLLEKVRKKEFREDLYYRIAQPVVTLPPLRDRVEDIPWLIDHTLREANAVAHWSLVEAALLQQWPGNVREFVGALRRAVGNAQAEPPSKQVRGSHLVSNQSGALVESAEMDSHTPVTASRSSRAVSAASVREALKSEHGNVSAAARRLGVHRTQLNRLLQKFKIDAKSFEHAD